MGQATVDLPDPLNPPPPVESGAASTDDLLAQMAGEEIDRLLAEQEGERAPSPAPADSGASAWLPIPQGVPSESKEIKQTGKDSLQGLLGGLTSEAESGMDAVAKLAEPAKSSPDGTKSTAELLDEELAADEARSASNSSRFRESAENGEPSADAAVPVPLRVLAWVSSPLDSCPDHVRESIGKVAIVTTVNAAAVLVYVLFFHTHHH